MCSFHDKLLVIITLSLQFTPSLQFHHCAHIACNYHTQQLCASNYFKSVTVYKKRMELRLLFSEGDSNFYVIALARGGNNANFLPLYTLRCFEVPYRWRLCLGKIFRLTKLLIPCYSPRKKRYYSIACTTKFHENVGQD